MTPTCRGMDPSTLEDILILKFNADLCSGAHNSFKRFSKKKKSKTVYVPLDQHPPLTLLLLVRCRSSSSAVNIFEDNMDKDNADEKEKEEADFDDK